jgi:hypothetical protein
MTASEGTWYYRIKQNSSDGATQSTDSIAVKVGAGEVALEGVSANAGTNQSVTLDWTTSRETGSRRFAVQVSRGDSLHFRMIPGSIQPGGGNSRTRRHYMFRDQRPVAGIWYYRLKHVDEGGVVRYSHSMRVNVHR